jgi:hypothetical protein
MSREGKIVNIVDSILRLEDDEVGRVIAECINARGLGPDLRAGIMCELGIRERALLYYWIEEEIENEDSAG